MPEKTAIQIPDLPQRNRRFFARATGHFDVMANNNDTATIDLYDEIGFFGVTARDFRNALKATTVKQLTVRINSPGGDVFDGIAMHNDLIAHPARIRVEISGLAASSASIVAMAGDEIVIAENAFLMIHNAWGIAIGDHTVMTEFAAVLAKLDGALARTYAARTGIAVEEIASMLAAETWMSGDVAVEKGFADEVAQKQNASALFDLSAFKNVPRQIRSAAPPERLGSCVDNKRDFERFLREAGFSRQAALALSSRGWDALDGRRDTDIAAATKFAESIRAMTRA
jgi:ATP-dependent Clp protease, protease subunit